MSDDLRTRYQRLNDRYGRSLIFNFGSEGGFYSEFNNMVFAILYCLKYGYRFVLYSDAATFKVRTGWDDYFEPFAPFTVDPVHRLINRRTQPPQARKARYAWRLYRVLTSDRLTFELWDRFYSSGFERERFDIAELGIRGDLREASRQIVAAIYRFNAGTRAAIARLVDPLALPARYAAVNIRRGDKDTEFRLVSSLEYLAKLDAVTDLVDVFVFTDDYRVVEELRALRPDKRFHTLTSEDERGYFHGHFASLPPERKYADTVKMLAAVEVMAEADTAVGTFTTNPGFFLGMKMPADRFHSVQRASWRQFGDDAIADASRDRVGGAGLAPTRSDSTERDRGNH